MTPFSSDKILVPVDFSDFSREALETAIAIAGEGGQLTVLYVMEEPVPPPGYDLPSVVYKNWTQMKEEFEKRSIHVLEAMMDEAGGGRRIEHICLWGNPVDVIIKMAQSGDFDLIVMSTHGRTGLNRLMMGSVVERVIRHVSRPILLIPRQQKNSKKAGG